MQLQNCIQKMQSTILHKERSEHAFSRAQAQYTVTIQDCLLTFKVTASPMAILRKKGESLLSKLCIYLFFSFWVFRSKYFRGKRIHGDYDIRVEQAEFKELSVNCNTEAGVTASIILAKSGNKVVRSFKPDFLLVRQNVRDIDEDHRNILLGFQYGNLPSVNTLDSIYNFQVRLE